ncbi:J-domain-containing protein [Arthrobacter rhombi]|uniref:J-domain-containing protein n=1 Tax=Arthrobacter rhombi TaxID=71253 RepID=UPI003FD4B254
MRPEPSSSHDAARLQAARYRDAQDAALETTPVDEYERRSGQLFRAKAERAGIDVQGAPEAPPTFHAADVAGEVATPSIDRAIARGDFDNLAYAGKPLPSLDSSDPDWWMKSLMQRERISGVGPPALLLRTEDAALDATLDALPGEFAVREMVADFNSRIHEARRQLLGGPPVITDPRDPEEEVRRWRERRATDGPPVAPAPCTDPPGSGGQFRRVWAWLWSPSS